MLKKRKAGFGLTALVLATPLVAQFEGLELRTYRDPVGIPTVCVGETDKELVLRDRFTKEECMAALGASMTVHALELSNCIHQPLKTHEAAALISWSYNVGTGAACASTLVRKLNAGATAQQWCPELNRWVYAGGKVLNGLVRRRKAETAMCLTGTWAQT